MHSFTNLMSPITFGKKIVSPNRMYFSSIGFDLCNSEGRPLPDFFRLYESIMGGGCGFGFLGNASIDPLSQYTDRSLKLTSQTYAEDLKPVFEFAKNKKFLLGAQLQHYGLRQKKHKGLSNSDSNLINGDVTILPEEEIIKYIDQFHDAACLALGIGAEAIQIHAANGYLLSSFLSPRTNRRSDKWGGSSLNRARILLEIIRRIRASVHDNLVIFVRLQVDDGFGKEGLYVELLEDVVIALEMAGADAVTCATGVADTFDRFLSDREYTLSVSRHAARFLKKFTRIPIGFASNIDDLLVAEKILDSGDADFIGFGRAIIADHNFVNKEISGLAHEVDRCRWDSYCLRDKKESLAERVYCCVNRNYIRPEHIQQKYQGK